MVSAIRSQIFPPLGTLSDRNLRVRKGAAQVLTGLLGVAALGSGGAAALAMAQKREGIDLLKWEFATGILAVGAWQLHNYIGDIDRVLSADTMGFSDLYTQNLLSRFPANKLKEKFKHEVLSKRNWSDSEYFFVNLSRRFPLEDFVRKGIVTIEDCRHSTYRTNLTTIAHRNVEHLFPLRSSLFTDSLPDDLREEAERQEADYRKFLAISNKYPKREWDFGGHFRDVAHWDSHPDKKKEAIRQQKAFAREIRSSFGVGH